MEASKPGGRLSWGARLVLSLAVGVVLLGALSLYVGVDDLGSAFASFDWRLIPVLLGLAVVDYAVRFLRWRLLFRVAAGRSAPLRADAAVFLAGTAMIVTPARMGEWLKSYHARRFFGVPVSVTAPIPIVERIADALAMSLLAITGILVFGGGPAPVVAALLIGAGALVGLRSRALAPFAMRVAARLPVVRRLALPIEAFLDSTHALCAPRPLAVAFSLGLVAWSLECLAFYVVLVGLDLHSGWTLLAQASFIYPVATLAGTFSFLPGGFGVTEGSITGLTQAMAGASVGAAAAAALLIRASIVGFGVVIGLPPLVFLNWRAAQDSETADVEPAVA